MCIRDSLKAEGHNILNHYVSEDEVRIYVQTESGLEELVVNENLFTNPLYEEALYISQKIKERGLDSVSYTHLGQRQVLQQMAELSGAWLYLSLIHICRKGGILINYKFSKLIVNVILFSSTFLAKIRALFLLAISRLIYRPSPLPDSFVLKCGSKITFKNEAFIAPALFCTHKFLRLSFTKV